MPPRLRPTAVTSSASHLPPTSTSTSVYRIIPSTRSFSSTPQNATRLRRRMWEWLNGPGKAFYQPLPGSTNYLTAYNREGKLRRLERAAAEARETANAESKGLDPEADEVRQKVALEEEGAAAAEGPEPVKAQAMEEEIEERDRNTVNPDEIPPEEFDDLRPFPLNRHFVSQPVLSEEFKDLIYKRVVQDKETIVAVSAQYNVSMERVAAVVRLKDVEKQWVQKGKGLATPYAKAVMEMLPTTQIPRRSRFGDRFSDKPHESINDLPVHRATRNQIFYPVPESRHFTREDAAKVFDANLLPADQRIPHPELILMEKARLTGLSRDEIAKVVSKFVAEEEARRTAIKEREQRAKERHTQVVEGRRWDFVFEDCSVEDAGLDGRGRRGVGWRYGMPHQDRKKGQVKIPTRVDA